MFSTALSSRTVAHFRLVRRTCRSAFAHSGRFFLLRTPCSLGVAVLTGSLVSAQQTYVKASNPGEQDRFGKAVAISGNTIVVGAIWEDSDAAGVNGNEASNSKLNSGAAYVFTRVGNTWAQQAYLKASNPDAGDFFGSAVAISADTIAVSAFREASAATGIDGNQLDNSAYTAGAVYVFTRTGTNWTQQAYIKASNTDGGDGFGSTLALDNDTLVVGATAEAGNSPGINGNQSDNSAPYAGAAYVFTRTGSTWTQQAYLKPSNPDAFDYFGVVALSGDTLVIGASGESSSATGVNGNESDNSLSSSGAAYVFVRSGATWTQQAYLKASNPDYGDGFGRVAIDADTIAVSAVSEASNATGVNGSQLDNSAQLAGAVYVFVRTAGQWSQQAYLKAHNNEHNDFFGTSLSLAGNRLAVGANGEDGGFPGINGVGADNNFLYSGAAYVFERFGSTWEQRVYLKADNVDTADYFGDSVALQGDTLVVGASVEKSSASGIDGNGADNSLQASGAVYIQDMLFLPQAMCFGDGSLSACPCGNSGTPGNGCANSAFASGALLSAHGAASATHDSLVLHVSFVPDGLCLFVQGADSQGGGAGVAFGDGLLCVGGGVIRLHVAATTNHAVAFPADAGSRRLHTVGGVGAGAAAYYQVLYRDNAGSYCTPATFNLTNGMQAHWAQ